ncbi:MAG: replicative DNA helicase [Thermodesulfobacteriota bacterium]
MSSGEASPLRVPPHHLEAERSVLGAILLDNEALVRVMEVLGPNDFYRDAHRIIYERMLECFEKGEPLDLVTLSNLLRARGQLDSVGGMDYLTMLVDQVPTAANAPYYAKIVREKAVLRRLIREASEILKQCYEDPADLEEFLDQVERSVFQVAENRTRKSFFPIKEIIQSSFETIESFYQRKSLITGVPSGFVDLDTLTSGFQPSDLIVVAARPSMGKTAFCLDVARYAAVVENIPVAVFSLEMSKEQIALRMLCSEAQVDGSLLRKGMLRDSDFPRLTQAAGVLSESPIFVDDTPGISALEMRAKARRLRAEKGVGLVIVDYLQLMRGRQGPDRSREQEISEISRSLKALAKELNVPVMALSQLNRRVEERGDKIPQLSDLRESGAIEQDADLILFIYRDEVYNRSPDNPKKGTAEIIVGKHRNGPTGKVILTFLPQFATFENYSGRVEVLEGY